jgi:hypothetical protein
LLAVLLVIWPGGGRSQEPNLDRDSYYSAADYCRHNVWPRRAMHLRADRQVLCFEGPIAQDLDPSLAADLKDNGLFVVRSPGGYPAQAIAISDIIRDRHATVVVYDYCFSACAGYFLVASGMTYVLKGTVVAWHYPQSDQLCTFLAAPRDGEPRRVQRGPCQTGGEQGYSHSPSQIEFFKKRAVNPPISIPPDSLYVRRIVSGLYAETGVFHNLMWTLHPRHYAGLFKTKIFYEAYPESQEELDGMLAKLRLKNAKVIYDP